MAQHTEMKSIESEARLGWHAAEELLRPFGAVAANFSEAIRLLVHHYEVGSSRLPLAAEHHVIRLLKNSTIKATYYFVTKEHRPQVLSPGKLIDAKEFFEAYTPIEHAVILAYCYLSRNLSRKTDKDDWAYVENPLYEALTIGGIIGQGVPEIGTSPSPPSCERTVEASRITVSTSRARISPSISRTKRALSKQPIFR
jgi:hypothetical protein